MNSAAKQTLAVLKANGIDRLFGNPGTTELALLDASVSEGVDFHLCLHEGAAVAMADGFGRATGTVGAVMVHTSVGAANTLTNLINARSDARPLLVIAGDKDDRLMGRGSFCEVPDLPGLLRPVAKEAWRVSRPEKMAELALRGLKVAQAPTPGPVFMAVHENHMAAPVEPMPMEQHARRASRITLRAHPDELRPILEALLEARQPVLVAGNEVGRARAVHLVVELAELLGLPVLGEEVFTTNALNFPNDHPLYHGNFSPDKSVLRDADLVVALGARMFMEYSYPETPYIRPGVRLLQLGSDATELGKIYPAERALMCDVGWALSDLLTLIRTPGAVPAGLAAARRERAQRPAPRDDATAPLLATAATHGGMHPAQLLAALDQVLPAGAAIVDESVLSKALVQSHLRLGGSRRYFGTSGGGLGWGIPAAIGVQLGLPNQRVVAVVGDGGALFNIQSLWTAAHLKVPVVVVVVNNGGYMAVRRGLGQFGGHASGSDRFPGSFIAQPEVDLCRLASGLGVQSRAVRSADELPHALEQAMGMNTPILLDVHVAPSAYY